MKPTNGPLRGAMAQKGVTAQALSKRVGITPLTFSRKLNGKSAWTTREARLICEALGIKELGERAAIFLND